MQQIYIVFLYEQVSGRFFLRLRVIGLRLGISTKVETFPEMLGSFPPKKRPPFNWQMGNGALKMI